MREIWFVDSVDADAFHVFPDCPALQQAVQPIVCERAFGLAVVIGTERFGDLRPCERCRQQADFEEEALEWADRLESSGSSRADAMHFLLRGEEPSAAMIRGDEPLRVFKQNFAQLRVFSNRLEIKPPALFGGGESAVIPLAEVREVRAVSWIPLFQAPAIEIDSELDGEVFTDRFELDARDSPEMLALSVEGLAKTAFAGAGGLGSGFGDAAQSQPASTGASRAATKRGTPIGAKSASPRKTGKARAPGREREKLARLWEENKKQGGSIFDQGSGADLTKSPMTGGDFADWVMAGCDSAEDRRNLAERLEEAVRFARFMAEANANPLTKPKRWAKLVVSIGNCDIEWEMQPYEPGGDGDPAAGGGPNGEPGGGAGPSAGGGGGSSKSKAGQRKRTPEEQEELDREWLKRHFPKMNFEKVVITAGRENRYNCLGLALGLYRDVWRSGALSREVFNELLSEAGFVSSPNGDVEFAVWAGPKGISHVSKILPDGRHESKFGIGGIQIIHDPSDFVDNNFYSNIRIVERRKGFVREGSP